MYLKQSTASQSRLVGPFVDDTDFKSAETGLTIANTDVKLSKNGAAGVDKNSGGGTHRHNGMYALTFDATDTDTVGELAGSISVAGALPVAFKFLVLEEAVYDALFAASAAGYLQPTTAGRTLDVSASGEAGIDWANIGAPTTVVTLSGTTIKTATDVEADTDAILTDTAEIGAAGAGLTAVPWNAAWDAQVESEVADALEATIADSVPVDGSRPSVKQALYLLTQFMLERAVSGTTVTVKKPDGTTTLFQLTLDDATSPTSITRSA